ncbi:DUF3566 domain-containing protein [Mycolicibacterium goodii]|uniref:DUF3566 domain-containing protein n=1 Tax=Mycolicibacterium goodii TaxID=134601 RepID=A0ABS6HQW8_MYCGD|nr:DUF3566 domain-containing protein [Mycolicibacterium goodii]MBU8825094.1 DUF3566 domain-containing protein [Mycolicibacterium goodii]MBU8838436.1 DUF3566 domain-containing protein [Mycolicibacterium goodii]
MSSPNEPGYPRAGDRPGATNGTGPGGDGGALSSSSTRATGHITDSGDVPPWQRGVSRTAQQPAQQPPADGRIGDTEQQPRPAPRPEPPRPEPRPEARNEAYASELPDLSGPVPRSAQRKTGSDAPRGSAPTTRIHVAGRQQPAGPVRASMQIRRVDPWTVLKVSLVLSVVLFFVWMIAVAFLYLVLGGMGVWSKLNSNVGDLLTSASGSSGGELVSSGTIFGGAALIGLVNIVVLSAMATVGAFIYNLTTDLVGGIEVTLADRE